MGAAVQVFKAEGLGNFALHMNMEKGFPWQTDVRVREAIWRLTPTAKQIAGHSFTRTRRSSARRVPAGLTNYQLDPKDTAPYYQNDVAKAKQLFAAANFDLSKDWDLLCSTTGSPSEQAGLVLQQGLQQAGMKTRVYTAQGSAHTCPCGPTATTSSSSTPLPAPRRRPNGSGSSTRRVGLRPMAASASRTRRLTP